MTCGKTTPTHARPHPLRHGLLPALRRIRESDGCVSTTNTSPVCAWRGGRERERERERGVREGVEGKGGGGRGREEVREGGRKGVREGGSGGGGRE